MEDFFSLNFADAVGIVLSIISIFVATRIPHALMVHKVEGDLSKNIKEMRKQILGIEALLESGELDKNDFLLKFHKIAAMLDDYTQYMDFRIYIREKLLNLRYKKLIENKDNQQINTQKAIILMGDYHQFINTLDLKTK